MTMLTHFRVSQWLMTVIAVLALHTTAQAQTTADEISARLKHKPLYLRGMWGEDMLRFVADGSPQKKYGTVTFTESGIDVSSVKIKNNELHIAGQRVGLEFDPKGAMKRVRIEGKDYSGKIAIVIEAPPGTDLSVALETIFAPDLASLAPVLPVYWKYYARKTFMAPGTPVQTADVQGANGVGKNGAPAETSHAKGADPGTAHVGGTVKPPKVLKTVEPQFTETARALRYSGNVQIYMWVDEAGSVSHLRVMRPAGLGLDEAAMAAVQQYKFAPATQNGKPVKVDLFIDVNFEIF